MTQDELKSLMHYNELTGICTWGGREGNTFFNSKYKGKTVGCTNKGNGYIEVKINRKVYKLHRLIWLYMTGEMPKIVDHIDHNRSNNIWINLRDVKTCAGNAKNQKRYENNSTGYSGVTFNKSHKKKPWCARIGIDGKRIYLGSFATKEDAIRAKRDAELKHGFHRNHNCVQ